MAVFQGIYKLGYTKYAIGYTFLAVPIRLDTTGATHAEPIH